MLTKNSPKNEIVAMQKRLIQLYYLLPVYQADGDFGHETSLALGAFEYEHDLRAYNAPLPTVVSDATLRALEIAPVWARGIDVSKYQGKPDFKISKQRGISYAIAKASGSDGSSSFYEDATFDYNYGAIADAGLIRGAYHFHSFDDPALDQARRFYREVGPLKSGDLPPTLDVENRTTPMQSSAALNHLHVCLSEMEQLFGVTPMLYTSKGVLQAHGIDTVDNGLERYPLYVPRYDTSIASVQLSVPACYPNKRAWKIWQLGASAIPGLPAGTICDNDFFQGSETDLRAFAKQ